jgi:hypothetical protein
MSSLMNAASADQLWLPITVTVRSMISFLVRDAGASVNPNRDAGRGERREPFPVFAWRPLVGDYPHVSPAIVRTDQRARNARAGGKRVSIDENFASGPVDDADCIKLAVLFWCKALRFLL